MPDIGQSNIMKTETPICTLSMVSNTANDLRSYALQLRDYLNVLQSHMNIPSGPLNPADTYEKPGPLESLYNDLVSARVTLEAASDTVITIANKLSCSPLERPTAPNVGAPSRY